MSGRRVIDHAKPRRIIRFAQRDQGGILAARLGKLALGVFQRIDFSRPFGATAPGESRKRLERRARSAKMIDERAKGARTDILAANEAQPVEPLLVGQAHAFAGVCDPHALSALVPIRCSVPASSRAILPRCVTKIRTVITTKSSAACGSSSAHKIAGVAALASNAESEE